MSPLWNDIKHAVHMFIKNPGFTLAAVSALVLGIGANTAIFTVVNAVLLKPLTYPDADRIVQFFNVSPDGRGPSASIPNFRVWQHQTNVFKEVAAYDFAGPGINITGDRPEQVHGLHVTEGYFRLFGAPVLLGRTFTPQEDAPNGGNVVVLSYGLWQRKFAGNPNIVGQSLSLGNEPYTMLGADRGTIRSLIVRQGMRLALVGVAIGIGAAFGLTRLIASFLFGVKTWDPLVFVMIPVILTLVALMAVWIPASRASKLNPVQALRVE